MGSSDDSGEAGFLCGIPGPTSSTTQQRTFTRFGHDMRIDVTSKIVKGIFENFPLRGHLRGSPKISKLKGSNRYLSLTGLHSSGRTTVMQWLLAAVVQGPNRASGQFFLCDLRFRSYGVSKFPKFRMFAYFPIQNAPPRHTTQRLHCRMLSVIPCCSGRALLVEFFCDVCWGSWGPLNLPKCSLMGNACSLHIQSASTRRVRSGTKTAQTRHSARRCALSGLNDVPLNFGSQTLKNSNFGPMSRTFKPFLSVNNNKIQILITSASTNRSRRNFTEDSHHEWALVGGPTTSFNKSKMAGWRTAAILNFVKY